MGVKRCEACHKAEFTEFSKTHHSEIKPARADSVTGCEMCHGPGAHAEALVKRRGDDAKTAAANKLIFFVPRESQAECGTLPGVPLQSSRDQKDFTHSEHLQHGVDCSSCHSMHLTEAGRSPKAKA